AVFIPYDEACRARADRFSLAAATAGLLKACAAVTARSMPVPEPLRLMACCGKMVTVTGLERHTFETLRAMRARGAAVHCIVNSWEHHRITPLAEAIGATWSVGSYHFALRRRALTPRRVVATAVEVLKTSVGLL